MRDYSKLRSRVKELLKSESNYATSLGLSEASVSAKLNGRTPFSIEEIEKSVELLEIPEQQIYQYFFVKKVENNSIKQ